MLTVGVGDKILIVDDDPDIQRLLHSYLRRDGFVPLTATTGAEAVAIAREERPALIVLDIMLPDFDGFEVCRRVRRFADCPIIFLTARTSETDKVLGFGLGGDDYVVKPFSPRELVERVKANLRRFVPDSSRLGTADAVSSDEPHRDTPTKAAFDDCILDIESYQLFVSGNEVPLTGKEFSLLKFLVTNANRVFTKKQLFESVWGEEWVGGDNTIMVHIHRLRQKIESDPSAPKRIVTVRGIGYKFAGEVDWIAD